MIDFFPSTRDVTPRCSLEMTPNLSGVALSELKTVLTLGVVKVYNREPGHVRTKNLDVISTVVPMFFYRDGVEKSLSLDQRQRAVIWRIFLPKPR